MDGKVLIVEESGFTRLHVRSVLEKQGFQVFEAVTGSQVINNTFNREVGLSDMDLIIINLYLPDYDGREILKRIVGQFSATPVIVMSSDKKKDTIISTIDMGAWDYLIKPFDKDTLLSRVQKYLPKYKEVDVNKKTTAEERRLNEVLSEEIDRAVRTDAQVTLVAISGDQELLKQIYELAGEYLRRIDSIFITAEKLILLLPATDEPGSEIVTDKLFNIGRIDVANENLQINRVTFPEAVSKELVASYRIMDITNELLSILDTLS